MPAQNLTPLLQLTGIDKSFPGVKALNHAGLTVYAGHVMALLGENGAGKSTLMKILTGIYSKDAGTIQYLGKEVSFKNPKQSQEAGISIIHQELNLVPNLTVAENIFLGREFTKPWGTIDWKKMFEQADRLLNRLNVKFSSRQLCEELSIGQQQMVEIAKAMSFDAKVIIMDEPTDALTETETQALFGVIKELKKEGRGIVYISHRLKEIFEICDAVTVLRDGQFIAQTDVDQLTENDLIEQMVGRKLEEQYPYVPRQHDALRLEVEDLSGQGLHHISFKLKAGEILGISGLMGAGRTELVKMIYGALPYESGTIRLNGQPLKIRSAQDALRHGIVYISEDRKGDGLVLGMSVKENMSLTSLHRFSTLGHIHHKNELQAVERFIQAFNVKTPSPHQTIKLLSGGNQQKVAIARGLMSRPQVLILDEPTRGVDVGAKKEIYELINRFKQEGLSIIMVSSDMPELLGISDSFLVIHNGQVSGEFTRDNVSQTQLMAAAIGQASA